MQVVAVVIALAVSVVGVALFARAAASIVGVVRLGRPAPGRSDRPADRWKHLLAETIGHTRMLQWNAVGAAHWFVFVAFGALFLTLITAYGQLFDPAFALPVIGHWVVYEWAAELIAWLGLASILFLMVLRLRQRGRGRSSRFLGSTQWQAVYVELTILGIVLCVLALRAMEYQLLGSATSRWHFPFTNFLLPQGISIASLQTGIVLVAALKIVISMAWFVVLGLHTTMGVAWHRFTVWPNIWFKREASGRPALGALPPILVEGKPLDFEQLEDLDLEATPLGVGKVEDFSWKGLLDFTSCTECGRCQSQCPAWNTEKPLSPKLLITSLRDHAYAKAPWLQAAEEARAGLPDEVRREAERPLVGATAGGYGAGPAALLDTRAPSPAEVAHAGPIAVTDGAVGVIDPDVLWSCTSCGACVQQCPVDIEHVDHIMELRRHQVLLAEEFPKELTGLFKGLESKGNPWNMSPRKRMDWAKGLPFDVPVVGEDVEDLTGVDYLFWVGCAGAFEDRAVKVTQAVAELLHTAGVTYAVLGNGETCTGDPARRAGNEFVFQQLAMENAATLTEARATKIVTSCAHCLNSLRNEYPQLGVTVEVVHHTQLLNRLVREGRLTPVAPPEGSVAGRTITYHDPCYLGRHNEVYDPPRDLLGALPGSTVTELPRNRQRSFCCGAGGARMWMEENLGTRINLNRTDEALETLRPAGDGPAAIATGCPFCRVMLSDGVTARQADGGAPASVEVLDVSQLLLESVRRGSTPTA
ncbi:Fe-S oxidoreductase [Friedmanniella endophytica]|uniref:Fe-S oxidoreductase n=1 Tax=Microlunatus kandeliicorticis TaxID=1759536 RepID=A0A7W3IQJ4_9ACTN|nr:heterodisulfide reductase-related iron-sulfur binding cluster [Microlunatus kandeliicorticis]MBA8793413.1 Fe-S oxidoreductase [Microlunatus kandeliicorticis]